MAAGAILKSLNPKLFHMTCIAPLLHYCTRKVESHSKDVDQLITVVKAATVFKTNPAKPNWLSASPCRYEMRKLVQCCTCTLQYAKSVPEVKAIMGILKGLLLSNTSNS